MGKRGPQCHSHKALLTRLGLVPPDTPFNRRAAAYAKAAVRLAQAEKQRKQNKIAEGA